MYINIKRDRVVKKSSLLSLSKKSHGQVSTLTVFVLNLSQMTLHTANIQPFSKLNFLEPKPKVINKYLQYKKRFILQEAFIELITLQISVFSVKLGPGMLGF